MKYLFSFYLLFITYYIYADVPGNKPRPDYDIIVSGLQQYQDFIFHNQLENDTPIGILKDGDTVNVVGGFGRPQQMSIWATNAKTKINTDTLFFYGGDYEKSVDAKLSITNNHLSFINLYKNDQSTDSINIVYKIDSAEENKSKIMYFISGFSLLFLAALAFIIWNKNKNKN